MAAGLPETVEGMRLIRRESAAAWRARLLSVEALRLPPETADAEPAFLRFPVLAATEAARESAVVALAGAGFGFVRSYPGALNGIPEFAGTVVAGAPTPGAASLATCLVALPCHVGVAPRDVDRAVAAWQAATIR